MLIPPTVAMGVKDGSVTRAYRRWRRPDVTVGSKFKTTAGVIQVDGVEVVDEAAITDKQAEKAGHKSADRLRDKLDPEPGRSCYKITLSYAGEDPRIKLRDAADLTDDEVADLDHRLDRLDRASSHGPWTLATLAIIGRRPHTLAADLARELGQEGDPFKLDVRRLKNLGLTRSHEVGYEISPRGVAYLARTRRGRPEPAPDAETGKKAKKDKKDKKKLRLRLGKK